MPGRRRKMGNQRPASEDGRPARAKRPQTPSTPPQSLRTPMMTRGERCRRKRRTWSLYISASNTKTKEGRKEGLGRMNENGRCSDCAAMKFYDISLLLSCLSSQSHQVPRYVCIGRSVAVSILGSVSIKESVPNIDSYSDTWCSVTM